MVFAATWVSPLIEVLAQRGRHWHHRDGPSTAPVALRQVGPLPVLATLGVVLAVLVAVPTQVAGGGVPPPVTVQSVNVLSSFTANVALASSGLDLKSVRFTVRPLADATAAPLSAVYFSQYLARTGRMGVPGTVTLPVFGLYPGKDNFVDIVFVEKGRTTKLLTKITTPAWGGVFDVTLRTDVVPRNPRVRLDYSYMLVAELTSVRCVGRIIAVPV